MSVLNRDEFFKAISTKITGTDDDDLKLIEDLTDTFNAMEKDAHGDGVNWKQKYEESNAAWSKRYKSRFFSSNGASEIIDEYDPDEDAPPKRKKADRDINIDDLFKNN
jgi:hypothetical protein